ncbi:hypothetical protein PJ985_10635 [Streptomyces sp. ACA25]|uniref:hypothetical protein n=1 Tax=Streptomyces sp. ACA25 TaxID=3022596 RepID=UPI002307020D|nr:hypothetical protein [Streptomyces sp. ACA25]MDB1088021.1 hypothetical protein [Streptomyces sp. ACA25]
MNQAVQRIGRSFALVIPVVLVLSGTLAVAQVPWAAPPSGTQVVATAERLHDEQAAQRAPEEVLHDELVAELHTDGPDAALSSLQVAMHHDPSLADHCPEIARSLGRATVAKYGSAERAQEHARPVCDTSFATGVAESP